MGSHNLYRKETKKPKKDAKKPELTQIIAPIPEVEVIRKKRKEPEEEGR